MSDRALPAGVVVLPGTDVDGAWERFEVFEALHHGMRICNPMTDADLDRVLAALDPGDGSTMLDIACGHGELLLRAAQRRSVRGVGVDLSPWVIVRSHSRADELGLEGTLQWWLGDAHGLERETKYDIVTCLGASWIWHGFEGTVRAVVERTVPGGRIAIGDLRLRDDADPERITETYGKVLTLDEQRGVLDRAGVDVLDRLEAGDAGWDGYQDRIDASASAWAQEHPGETSTAYLQMQAQWRADHERDRRFLDWTVWIGVVR